MIVSPPVRAVAVSSIDHARRRRRRGPGPGRPRAARGADVFGAAGQLDRRRRRAAGRVRAGSRSLPPVTSRRRSVDLAQVGLDALDPADDLDRPRDRRVQADRRGPLAPVERDARGTGPARARRARGPAGSAPSKRPRYSSVADCARAKAQVLGARAEGEAGARQPAERCGVLGTARRRRSGPRWRCAGVPPRSWSARPCGSGSR